MKTKPLSYRILVFISIILSISACVKKKPVVTTLAITDITQNSVSTGGNVTDEGSSAVTARGLVWGIADPSLEKNDGLLSAGSGTGIFESQIPGLLPYTDYIVRAFASNQNGTAYGNKQEFKTLADWAAVTTASIADITDTTALAGGEITSTGGAEISERGVYYGTSSNPEINGTKLAAGSGPGTFTIKLNGLAPNMMYYVKAYAVNPRGQKLGTAVNFTTTKLKVPALTGSKLFNTSLTYGSVNDVDGNAYKTIVIGTQTWFAENLKTTRYNDGAPIQLVTDNSQWISLSTPAYCWYDNNPLNKELMGAKYNWWVAASGKVCPAGWHIPTTEEWSTLMTCLGGNYVAGGKLKETGTTHWWDPNAGAINSSGFTSIPAGQRFEHDGSFGGAGNYDVWWSSTEYNVFKSWYRSCSSTNNEVFESAGSLKVRGFGLRCVKD